MSDSAGRGSRQLGYTLRAGRGTVINVTDWSVPARTWRYRIDAAGDLVEVTNPRELALGSGKSTRYTYYTESGQENLDHNLRCVILPEGERDPGDVEPLCGPAGQGHTWTHFVYYANDLVYEQTSSLGEVSHLYYDFFRRRTEVVFPDGAKEAYIFDRVGNIIRMETGRGVVHSYEYEDGTRNRTHELDGFGRATTATYDGLGNVTSRTDRLGNTELWTYNARSQPTSHVDRNGHRREWRYL